MHIFAEAWPCSLMYNESGDYELEFETTTQNGSLILDEDLNNKRGCCDADLPQ
jgi:hypothetical protein